MTSSPIYYITFRDTFAYLSFFFFMQYFLTISTVLCPGFCTASTALFSFLQIVFEIISIGTLLAFYLVANALIYHRYAKLGTSRPFHVLIFMFLTLSSLGFYPPGKIYGWCRRGTLLFGIFSVAIASLPLHSTAGLRHTTIGLVSPHDAMACRCICLLQCVADSPSQCEVLPKVRHMEPCDHSLLRLLRDALYIHCRRK
jgi:hypothetical protein